MTIAFPAEWRLSHNEEAVLSRLALSTRRCPMRSTRSRRRRGAVRWRPFKVLLHYLRRKLAPHGITIISRKGVGFALTADSNRSIAAAAPSEAACRGCTNSPPPGA